MGWWCSGKILHACLVLTPCCASPVSGPMQQPVSTTTCAGTMTPRWDAMCHRTRWACVRGPIRTCMWMPIRCETWIRRA